MGSKDARHIAVIYENSAIREHAVRFCDRLGEDYHYDAGPEINWWSFRILSQPATANDAARKAAATDLIVFATSAEGDLPRDVKLWIENWLGLRGEREGALVSLIDHGEQGSSDVPPFKQIYLRHIAHRAGMDFLSHAPRTLSKALPDSLDSFNDRAGCITSTLKDILLTHPHAAPPPLF